MIIRTHRALDIVQAAGLEKEFDTLVERFKEGDMLGFIACCHTLMEECADVGVRAALLHFIIGTAFVVGGHDLVNRMDTGMDERFLEAVWRSREHLSFDGVFSSQE